MSRPNGFPPHDTGRVDPRSDTRLDARLASGDHAQGRAPQNAAQQPSSAPASPYGQRPSSNPFAPQGYDPVGASYQPGPYGAQGQYNPQTQSGYSPQNGYAPNGHVQQPNPQQSYAQQAQWPPQPAAYDQQRAAYNQGQPQGKAPNHVAPSNPQSHQHAQSGYNSGHNIEPAFQNSLQQPVYSSPAPHSVAAWPSQNPATSSYPASYDPLAEALAAFGAPRGAAPQPQTGFATHTAHTPPHAVPSRSPSLDPAYDLRQGLYDGDFGGAHQPYGAAQHTSDPRGYDASGYALSGHGQTAPFGSSLGASHGYPSAADAASARHDPQFADWQHNAPGQQAGYQGASYYGDDYGQQLGHDEHGLASGAAGHDGYTNGVGMTYAEADGGELDAGDHDDQGEYEYVPPRRSRRPLLIAATLAGAIFAGGGLAYGYKSFFGAPSDGGPPLLKNVASPAKIKPLDAGGKQFAHSDSKILGRLGDGTPIDGADAQNAVPSSSSSVDSNGTRKVQTVVVGRDGSIAAPSPPPGVNVSAGTNAPIPGMTIVDTQVPLPSSSPAAPSLVNGPAASNTDITGTRKIVVTPPAQKPVVVARADPQPPKMSDAQSDVTGSVAPERAAPKEKPARKVVAAVATTDDSLTAVAAPASTGSAGYVAVVASVPRSDNSRMVALTRFADLQQKYGNVLQNKTPDVQEANLGAKGAYHRLVVGPPGSREQASGLCSQLKTAGYTDCWVTAY